MLKFEFIENNLVISDEAAKVTVNGAYCYFLASVGTVRGKKLRFNFPYKNALENISCYWMDPDEIGDPNARARIPVLCNGKKDTLCVEFESRQAHLKESISIEPVVRQDLFTYSIKMTDHVEIQYKEGSS